MSGGVSVELERQCEDSSRVGQAKSYRLSGPQVLGVAACLQAEMMHMVVRELVSGNETEHLMKDSDTMRRPASGYAIRPIEEGMKG